MDLEAFAREPYEERGILHSEVLLIIQVCRALKINCLIESGRCRGQSTYMLGKYMPDVQIHSVEKHGRKDEAFARERLKPLKNVSLLLGLAEELLPGLIEYEHEKNIAILLDGPKREPAIKLLGECFRSRQVKVGFLHDLGPHEQFRLLAMQKFPRHQFADDSDRWLDAGAPPEIRPTLGVFYNNSIDHPAIGVSAR